MDVKKKNNVEIIKKIIYIIFLKFKLVFFFFWKVFYINNYNMFVIF